MISDNYYYTSEEYSGDITAYEEQLLLNYDDYLQGNLSSSFASNHYNLELDDLEDEFLDDDMDSEYDENDWEEEEDDEAENYEEDDSPNETFQMKS
ncbi:hypothetical protein [Flavobacterium ginsengiterrae]|uniref:Uncharacterized protein n=1 Tax=Flavobacterium ginsengiterrae TaxID=871695 RepID=A0ABP7GYJ5_9FLAO